MALSVSSLGSDQCMSLTRRTDATTRPSPESGRVVFGTCGPFLNRVLKIARPVRSPILGPLMANVFKWLLLDQMESLLDLFRNTSTPGRLLGPALDLCWLRCGSFLQFVAAIFKAWFVILLSTPLGLETPRSLTLNRPQPSIPPAESG